MAIALNDGAALSASWLNLSLSSHNKLTVCEQQLLHVPYDRQLNNVSS